ncbi:MAG: hypothetical protein ACO1RX_19190 [Candidatus Sericytochromatia bacterium]
MKSLISRGLSAGLALGLVLSLSACDIPELPVGNNPVPQPTARPNEDDPVCLQTLQCIVDTTNSNSLRRDAQEVITDLFLLGEPDYTRICVSKAEELAERVPSCARN